MTKKLNNNSIRPSLGIDEFAMVGSFFNGSDFIVLRSQTSIFVVNLATDEITINYSVENKTLEKFSFFGAKSLVAWVESSNIIKVKNIISGELVFYYNLGAKNVATMELSPDGESILWVDFMGTTIVAPLKIYSDTKVIEEFKNLKIPPLSEFERNKLGLDTLN